MGHQGGSDSLGAKIFCHPHRFNFSVGVVQLLQRTAPDETTVIPCGPERDLRVAQTVQIQGMFAFRRRDRAHIAEMLFKKSGDFRSRQIVNSYDHKNEKTDSWYFQK